MSLLATIKKISKQINTAIAVFFLTITYFVGIGISYSIFLLHSLISHATQAHQSQTSYWNSTTDLLKKTDFTSPY